MINFPNPTLNLGIEQIKPSCPGYVTKLNLIVKHSLGVWDIWSTSSLLPEYFFITPRIPLICVEVSVRVPSMGKIEQFTCLLRIIIIIIILFYSLRV